MSECMNSGCSCTPNKAIKCSVVSGRLTVPGVKNA